MEKKSFQAPVFFPSASRVKIPFVGDDTTNIKVVCTTLNPISNPLLQHQKNVVHSMIKEVSKGFEFGKDVIKERCSHALPYDEAEILKVYDCSDVVSSVSKFPRPDGRFDTRQYRRKVPCQFKKMSSPRAAYMPQNVRTVTERHGEMLPNAGHATDEGSSLKHFSRAGLSSPRKSITSELTMRSDMPGARRQKTSAHWDEHVLSKLSKDTARWIVFENLESGSQKERLDLLVRKKFGAKISNTNLVREDAKELDFTALERRKEEKQKIKLDEQKQQQKLENKARIQNDPVLQQTFAQYYKLPRYLKQQSRKLSAIDKEVNKTAQNLKVKHLEPLPPTKMEDFLNPAAGSYIYSTENAFEQQLYTNQAKPSFQRNRNKTQIIMDDLSEYHSNLQELYPPLPSKWSQVVDKPKQTKVEPAKNIRGMHRWTELPQPADFASERGLNLPKSESTEVELFDLSRSSVMLNNTPLIHIIDDWRSKWKLAGHWQEVTMGDILLDLDNIHGHIRLAAVAACAMAALHKIPVVDIAVLAVLPKINASTLSNKTEVGHLFTDLLDKVRARLNDSHKRVQLAAAMCLYTLSEINDEVMKILEYNLENGVSSDRMACAQCLALKGSTDARVVHLIIQMLLETDEQEQATSLLVHLSQHTRLVHSLLAEQLNSSCWKDKVVACNVLSQLSGNINRDLVHKLSNLMWGDWSSEVRKAASKALGKTGHGRDVHFELREKLVRGNERVCADVLRKIAHLGIMTATLLPEYLKCFNAEYISVRLESVRAAAKLKIKDEKVIKELLRLTQYDPAWKIKAFAIKAIGEIEILTDHIQHALVWALRFEDEPGVRLEACIAIKKLKCDDEEVILVLQDRVLVEPSPQVKEEVKDTLVAFGVSGPEDNMEMIRQIKTEVKKLCKKSVVAAKVIMYEKELHKFEHKAQYIGNMLDDDSSSDVSDDDDVDMEISRAWTKASDRNKSAASQHRVSSTSQTPCPDRTPTCDRNKSAASQHRVSSTNQTPCPDRPATCGTPRLNVARVQPELAPTNGLVSKSLTTDLARA